MELEADVEKRRINQRMKNDERDRQVRADLTAAGDVKAKSKVTSQSSNTYAKINPYGPKFADYSYKKKNFWHSAYKLDKGWQY